jgi:oligopeptide/dipeptide ABC transporter ATP-binding protein
MTALDGYLLQTEELCKWFPVRRGFLNRAVSYLRAVDGVSIGVRKGETLGLVGESGCGKTTLGRTIMRLTDPTSGSIIFDGVDLSRARRGKVKPFRRQMQMVFQDPYASLDPRQSVRSALLEPMKIHHTAPSGREANAMAERLMERVGLSPDHLARFPHEFSGGQRQRIAIAIALAVEPSFLVLDEPTSSLDVSVQAQILTLMKDLQDEMGLTYLFISHNLAVIKQMCDRTAVMYLGRVVELAPTRRLFENPTHPYTRALMSAVPIPDPAKRKDLATLEGDVPSPVEIPKGCRFRTRCPYATAKCEAEAPPLIETESDHWVECHYAVDLGAGRLEMQGGPGPHGEKN